MIYRRRLRQIADSVSNRIKWVVDYI